MSDIFSDVDEAVRRERYLYLWQRYGSYTLGVALLVALLIGGAFFWNSLERDHLRASSLAFDEALRLEGSSKLGALARVSAAGGVYADLADFHRASLFTQEGRKDEALELYEALGAREGLPQNLRALARLHFARLSVGRLSFDALEAFLEKDLEDAAPFRFSAKEVLATAALLHGEHLRARALYRSLVLDINAPASLQTRAKIMLQSLPADIKEAKTN